MITKLVKLSEEEKDMTVRELAYFFVAVGFGYTDGKQLIANKLGYKL